ncbi:MAG: NAD(+) synthase [Candidatus Izemoplasmatales bacterium]|jgi:NAD+ synthase (glutamine-hydrolysing)|nr:NAD(+) synthase [Candidatus Izemoplasmatales bacterium]MDD3864782.1 NAD(+) synthase [Candidatus Izemoplasmatales bacterium]
MYKNGFLKVCLISPAVTVGNPKENVKEMLRTLEGNTSAICVFPELGITAYSCNDLFMQKSLLDDAISALDMLLKSTSYPGVIICGMPFEYREIIVNVAIVIQKQRILGIVPKFYLPNTKEYYEKRWFNSGFDLIDKIKSVKILDQIVPFGNLLFESGDIKFGIEICEDMWATITPGNLLSVNGANLIINLSASNETLGKEAIRRNAVLEHSRKNTGAYIYVSSGPSESTSETVYSGHKIVAANGALIAESQNNDLETGILSADLDIDRLSFERRNNSSYRESMFQYHIDYQVVEFALLISDDYHFETQLDTLPFIPKTDSQTIFNKISKIQELALMKRLSHLHIKHVLIGVSGGLDSALALIVACRVFDRLKYDRKGIIALSMPGMATSDRTRANANKLMTTLDVTKLEIDLKTHVIDHLALLGHDGKTEDITYENAQARERTMVLMNLANKYNGIVLGTGDLSEIALGWSTYNGDQMSMYNVNAGIPKTLIRFMVDSYADHFCSLETQNCLHDIINTPITPELKAAQSTENVIGKYEINDFILYRFLMCGDTKERIIFLLKKAFDMEGKALTDYANNFFKRFYAQQYKRQASPDSPKVMDFSLSPRSDFRMPSDVER